VANESGITVALPIYRASPDALRRALACIRDQTALNLDILLVLNGADPATVRAARQLIANEPRARILELPEPGLAAALNAALSSARFDLVARMDADDTCPPHRLERQADFLGANPGIAALGTAFEGYDDAGTLIGTERPPTDPDDIRWRLHLGNLFCHGSMMLRRGPVQAVGGYNPDCRFAQDYDLWLRLSRKHDMANLSGVLYRYRAAPHRRHVEQAVIASTAMVESWSALPPLPESARPRLSALLAHATWGGQRARESLDLTEALLREVGPSTEALMAWQWIAQRAGLHWANLADLNKLDHVRAAGRRLAAAGVKTVWLYGAGRHTGWLLENLDALGAGIAGIADDRLIGASRHGHDIVSPADIPAGANVLISSDAHEDALWTSAGRLRARGINIWRIYGAAPAEPPTNAAGISPPGMMIGS